MRIQVESVSGAARHLQKGTDAPASVTIVSAEEIRRYGYRTLGELLQSVPGFYRTYDRNYTYAAVRGFGRTGDYNSRILLLLDGHRLNDNIYDQALLGLEFPVDLDLIERVEVIHGPSSSLYGSNAFFAVLDVITRQGAAADGLEASLLGASQRTSGARLTFGKTFPQLGEMLLSASWRDSRGNRRLFFPEFDAPETNHGIAQDADRERLHQWFARLQLGEVTVQGVYGARQKGIPTASFGTVFNDSRERSTDRRGYLDTSYAHRFRKNWDLAARVYLDSYIYDADYPYMYHPQTSNQVILNHDYSNGAWWGEEVQLAKPFLSSHRLTVGSEFRDNFRQKQSNLDLEPFVVYLDSRPSSTVWALYAQDEYAIRKDLLLNASLRHDEDSVFGGTTNPRLGLIYNGHAGTTLKLLYGTAFRAPNAYELYYVNPASGLPNPNLRPETIRTAEIGLEQYVGERLLWNVRVFQSRIAHLINQVDAGGGLLYFQNGGSARTTGVELVSEFRLRSGLGGKFNYTYEHAIDPGSGELLRNAPLHLANANLLAPLLAGKLTAGLDLHVVSSRQTLAGNPADAFVLANLTLLSTDWLPGLELSGTIYNLLDSRYGYPGGEEHAQDILYQDGTTGRFKISYRFGAAR